MLHIYPYSAVSYGGCQNYRNGLQISLTIFGTAVVPVKTMLKN